MITIAERFSPYTHQLGARALIPGTVFSIRAYPARIIIEEWYLDGNNVVYDSEAMGPLDGFTLQQDLEKRCVFLLGKRDAKNLIWKFEATADGIVLTKNKQPELIVKKKIKTISPLKERLSLGSHKAQEWERLILNQDVATLLPLWLKLGQMTPHCSSENMCSGTLSLLNECQESTHTSVIDSLMTLLKVGFRSILFPVLDDDLFHGLTTANCHNVSPLILLHKGSKLIRSLFIKEDVDQIYLLPSLPPKFVAGRMTDVDLSNCCLSMEWKKKQINKLEVQAKTNCSLLFKFNKKVSSFRVKKQRHEKGTTHSVDLPLEIQEGTTLFLDRFIVD
ncbi:MAG: hypothetical protein JHC93_02215 [Parachlamydiales bacterium]|nr:hypothetical protein [Parachlamydiales bacterium]